MLVSVKKNLRIRPALGDQHLPPFPPIHQQMTSLPIRACFQAASYLNENKKKCIIKIAATKEISLISKKGKAQWMDKIENRIFKFRVMWQYLPPPPQRTQKESQTNFSGAVMKIPPSTLCFKTISSLHVDGIDCPKNMYDTFNFGPLCNAEYFTLV